MATHAVIFDLDGTLVDTNAVHAEAWGRSFRALGYDISLARIAPEIGKGGDNLVPSIIGDAADEKDGDALRARVGEEFLRIASETHFRIFPGAQDLLRALSKRGIETAIATSGQSKFLDAIARSAGTDLRDDVDRVVTASDAEASKPDPDLVVAAVAKLDVERDACVMIGDTPHDGEACRRAGVAFVGVLCGGNSEATLRAAGARDVWRDPADLLAHLDEMLDLSAASHATGAGG